MQMKHNSLYVTDFGNDWASQDNRICIFVSLLHHLINTGKSGDSSTVDGRCFTKYVGAVNPNHMVPMPGFEPGTAEMRGYM